MYTKDELKENTPTWLKDMKETSDLPIEDFVSWDWLIKYLESVNKVINE
jgi:hypothetical protein